MRFQRTLIQGRDLPALVRPFGRLLVATCLLLGAMPRLAWAAPATTATALAVTSAGNAVTTVASGGVVTLTATVTAGSTPVTPGQVNFCDATAKSCADIHLLGTAQLTSNGTATLKFRPGIGSHSYQAVFAGTATNAASASTASALSVTAPASPGPQVSATSIVPSGVQGNYTLTASVSSNGSATPTGMVAFIDTSNSNAVLGTAMLAPVSSNPGFASGSIPLGQLARGTDMGNQLTSVATGDFNSDGIPDMAVLDHFGSLFVMLGKGDGTFETPLGSGVATVSGQFLGAEIAVADFNGDGKLDLALISQNDDPPSVAILLGNGDGTFTESQTLDLSIETCCVALGDFNADGILDLAVVNSALNEVTILMGKGDGTFTQGTTMTINATNFALVSVAAGDFNGDGELDLAISNDASNTVTIMLGNGDGTFTTAAASPATGYAPGFITVADFNGDGKPDLAVTTSSNLTLLLGNGDGTFTAASSPITATGLGQSTVADFNGDGTPDVAITNSATNTVVVLNGNGDGTFTAAPSPATGMDPANIVAADFNGDGRPDLAVGNTGDFSVTVLLAETALASASVNDIAPVGMGTHLVDASYSGDAIYNNSVSGVTSLIVGPPSVLLSTTPVTIAAGASGNAIITVTPINGFTGSVALSCDGASYQGGDVDIPTCSAISPVNITSKAAVSTTLIINTQRGTTPGQYGLGVIAPNPVEGTNNPYIGTNVAVTVTASATAPSPDFALSSAVVPQIPTPGGTGTSTITITPSGGFTGSVTLGCAVYVPAAGALYPPTCTVTAPPAITGTAAVTATLTFNTTAPSNPALPTVYTAANRKPISGIFPVAGGVAFAALLCIGLPFRRRKTKALWILLLFISGAAFGCGTGMNNNPANTPSTPGTTAGTYTVTVTGVSGTIMATTSVTVTVN